MPAHLCIQFQHVRQLLEAEVNNCPLVESAVALIAHSWHTRQETLCIPPSWDPTKPQMVYERGSETACTSWFTGERPLTAGLTAMLCAKGLTYPVQPHDPTWHGLEQQQTGFQQVDMPQLKPCLTSQQDRAQH